MLIVANPEVLFEVQKYFNVENQLPNIDYYTNQAKQAASKYISKGKEFIVK